MPYRKLRFRAAPHADQHLAGFRTRHTTAPLPAKVCERGAGLHPKKDRPIGRSFFDFVVRLPGFGRSEATVPVPTTNSSTELNDTPDTWSRGRSPNLGVAATPINAASSRRVHSPPSARFPGLRRQCQAAKSRGTGRRRDSMSTCSPATRRATFRTGATFVAKVCDGGAGVHAQGGARGGAEVAVCEAKWRGSQPDNPTSAGVQTEGRSVTIDTARSRLLVDVR